MVINLMNWEQDVFCVKNSLLLFYKFKYVKTLYFKLKTLEDLCQDLLAQDLSSIFYKNILCTLVKTLYNCLIVVYKFKM